MLFWVFWFMRAIQLGIIAEKNASILLIELCIFSAKHATCTSYPHDYTCTFGGKFTADYELFVMGIKVPITNV